MKIPETNSIVRVQHFGRVIEAVVQDVKPDPLSKFRRFVTLAVPGVADKSDRFQWIDDDGTRIPAMVQKVAGGHGASLVTLPAIDYLDYAMS